MATTIVFVLNTIQQKGIPKYVSEWHMEKIPNLNTIEDLHNFLNKIVTNYHHHSFIMSDYVDYDEEEEDDQEEDEEEEERRPTDFSVIDDEDIGIIKFYTFFGNKNQSTKMVNNARKILNSWKNNKGLIIDLTEHEGGSIQPFIDSLVDILGDTTLLSYNKVGTDKKENKWSNLIDGELIVGKFMTSELRYKKPIAVVVSHKTCSSGEIAASIFCGRKNARLFGETTSGHLSVNDVFPFKDFDLVLTTGLITTVDGVFQEEEKLKVKKSKHPFKDAVKWIKQN